MLESRGWELSENFSPLITNVLVSFLFRTNVKLEGLEDAFPLDGQDDTLEDKHGCPAYVSPEILQASGGYSGKAADVWSLGVMLYTMLVGRYPFHDTEPSVLFTKIRRGHFTIPDTISSKAKCLIRSMMRREPTERLSAREILEHPWFMSSFHITSPCKIDQKLADQTVPDLAADDTTSFFVWLCHVCSKLFKYSLYIHSQVFALKTKTQGESMFYLRDFIRLIFTFQKLSLVVDHEESL